MAGDQQPIPTCDLAVAVQAVEAARFSVEYRNQIEELGPLGEHIRPGESTPEARSAALQAFREIMEMCLRQDKDGAIEVGGDHNFYCLVKNRRHRGIAYEVLAFITPCRDSDEAMRKLSRLRARWTAEFQLEPLPKMAMGTSVGTDPLT